MGSITLQRTLLGDRNVQRPHCLLHAAVRAASSLCTFEEANSEGSSLPCPVAGLTRCPSGHRITPWCFLHVTFHAGRLTKKTEAAAPLCCICAHKGEGGGRNESCFRSFYARLPQCLSEGFLLPVVMVPRFLPSRGSVYS